MEEVCWKYGFGGVLGGYLKGEVERGCEKGEQRKTMSKQSVL